MSAYALQGNKASAGTKWYGVFKKKKVMMKMTYESHSGSNDNSTINNNDFYILKVFYMLGTMPSFLLGQLDFNSQFYEADTFHFHVTDEAKRQRHLPKVV